MNYRNVVRSILIAGLTAANPDALSAPDEADLQSAFEHRNGQTARAIDAKSATEITDHRAATFIVAFNSMSQDVLAQYEIQNRSPRSGAIRWLHARLDDYAERQRRWGRLDVHAVHPVGEHALAITARSERTGEWVSVALAFEEHAPYMLRSSRLDAMVIPM